MHPVQFLRNPKGKSFHTYKSLFSLFSHYLVPYNLIYTYQFVLAWENLVKANFNPSICQSYLRLQIRKEEFLPSMSIYEGLLYPRHCIILLDARRTMQSRLDFSVPQVTINPGSNKEIIANYTAM